MKIDLELVTLHCDACGADCSNCEFMDPDENCLFERTPESWDVAKIEKAYQTVAQGLKWLLRKEEEK